MTAHALGSWQQAKKLATATLLDAGWSRLDALVGGHIASFGSSCFETYGAMQEVIKRPDGRGYHRESIARSARKLRDAHIVASQRIFVGGLLPITAKNREGKWRSSRGTTIKAFQWRAIEQKNPFNRRQQRLIRYAQASKARESGAAEKRPAPAPRHVSARAIVEPVHMPVPVDPEMARLVARAQSYATRTPQREPEQAAGRPRAPERPPPD